MTLTSERMVTAWRDGDLVTYEVVYFERNRVTETVLSFTEDELRNGLKLFEEGEDAQ